MYIDRKGWDIPEINISLNLSQENNNELTTTISRSITFSNEIEEDIKTIMNDFGFLDYKVSEVKLNTIPVGKMSPINEKLRKDFIYKLTNDYNVWSFGRNGIWKSITLDRLFDDIHKIDRMITNGLYHRNQLSSI
jgi:hypothetical protein